MPVIEWFKDGEPVELNERIQQVENADGQSELIFNKPTPADSGLYKCVATNSLGTVEQEHPVVFTPPTIPATGRREYPKRVKAEVIEDESDETKVVEKEPPPPVVAPRHVHIVEESKVHGAKTEFDDGPALGGFKTHMVLDKVEYVRRHLVPSMREIRDATRCKLSFATHLTNRVVAEGMRAKLSCVVQGPGPIPRWTKDDVAIKYGSKYKNACSDGICGIEIMNCRREDSGRYELSVKNAVSCLTSECQLEVYSVRKSSDVAPMFIRNLKRE